MGGPGEFSAPGPTPPSGWAEVDGYDLTRLLRQTSSADVYLGYHHASRAPQEVLVVQLRPGVDQAALRRAVEAEVFAAGAVHHAAVAPVVDVGRTHDGRLFVATARPAGRSLREILAEEGVLPLRRAVDLGLAIVEVVAAAHNAGVVHGRLTPDSVIVVPQQIGQPERVVILGFGTAVAQDGTPGPDVLRGQTDPFLSPERAAGAPASLRGDVFGLGSVLLTMFIGGLPPLVRAAPGKAEPAGVDPEPRTVLDVLRRARAADPYRRYALAGNLGAALRAADPYARDSLAANLGATRSTATAPQTEPPQTEPPQTEPPQPERTQTDAPFGAPAFVAPAVAADEPAAARVTPFASSVAVAPADVGLVLVPEPGGAGRRRRATLVVAAFASAFVVGWAARAWQRHTATAIRTPPAQVARAPKPVSPPQPAQTAVVASVPARVPADGAMPQPQSEPGGSPPPTASAPARVTVPSSAPSGAERVEGRAVASAARSGATPVREPGSVARRRAAADRPVARVMATEITGTAERRTPRAPSAETSSAAGDVAAAGTREASTGPANAAAANAAGAEVAGAEVAGSAAGVRAAVAEYARAIEARDLGWLGRVYPGMTEAQRRAWVTFFGSVADLRARLVVDEVTAAGATAQARVRGTYEYQNLRPHRAERAPVSFTATLARDASGWRVRAVR